jgi:hypothetical protein
MKIIETTHEVSIKGKMIVVPAYRLDDVIVVTKGMFLRVAEVFDEYWLEAETLPDPLRVLQCLRDSRRKPDLFTFAQRVPDTQPRFDFRMEWDNVAVIPIVSHDSWFREQISASTRRNIRASEKKGVVTRAAEFDDGFVHGIMSIFNESPVRGGRKFWHYGKSFESVQAEQGTYRDRSTFLGAYFQGQLIGYTKIVWDTRTAAIMQILSTIESLDKRPNNALLSEAVRLCAERGVEYLLYEAFGYGNKTGSSLTRFKESNGFVRMDLPRYYVPITHKGSLALRLGLHRDPKDLIPNRLRNALLDLRERYYRRRMPKADGRPAADGTLRDGTKAT